MVEVHNLIEIYVETVLARIQSLSTQRACPPELKEALCSIVYAAPHLQNEELSKFRIMVLKKFGKKFPGDCQSCGCINPKLIQRLSNTQPDEGLVNYYMSAIAKKHDIQWTPPMAQHPVPVVPNLTDFTEPAQVSNIRTFDQTGEDDLMARLKALEVDDLSATSASASEGVGAHPSMRPSPKQPEISTLDAEELEMLTSEWTPVQGQHMLVYMLMDPQTQAMHVVRIDQSEKAASTTFSQPSDPYAQGLLTSAKNAVESHVGCHYASLQAMDYTSRKTPKGVAFSIHAVGTGGQPMRTPTPMRPVVEMTPNGHAPRPPPLPQTGKMEDGRFFAQQIRALHAKIFQQSAMVLDMGSGVVKAGFAGEAQPRAIFPAIVGKPMFQSAMANMGQKSVYIGDEAQKKRGILNLQYPMEQGIIRNWSDMEDVWTHTFYNELRCAPEEHPILLTEPPLNPLANREKMAEVMFETFQCPAVYIAVQAVLALYASGRTTGLVLDCGDGVCHTVPVYEGYTLKHSVGRLNMGGRDISMHLAKILSERGYQFESTAQKEVARDIKEKLGYVSKQYAKELKKGTKEVTYTMPDGQVLTIGNERFRSPEILFHPRLIGRDTDGVHQLVRSSVDESDMDVRRVLYGNIVLSGGSTLFPGFPERLSAEVQSLAPKGVQVKVSAPESRQTSIWSGGSVMASMEKFYPSWCTRLEYDEVGPHIVHRKFA